MFWVHIVSNFFTREREPHWGELRYSDNMLVGLQTSPRQTGSSRRLCSFSVKLMNAIVLCGCKGNSFYCRQCKVVLEQRLVEEIS